MKYIDVHCHLDFFKDKEIKEIIEKCEKKKIKIIANGVNSDSNRKILEIYKKYPKIKIALGLYPIDALKLSEKEINSEIEFIKKNKNNIIGIGEVGIDLKENQNFEKQKTIFIKLIRLSKKINKPLIVHSRKAEKQVIEILEKENAKKVIMHCFCGKKKLSSRIIENNWFFSIPTNIKNSQQFQELVKITPMNNLLCETDSPFLHPNKKFPNTSENVIECYKKISEIKNMSLKVVEEKIKNNYKRIFEK